MSKKVLILSSSLRKNGNSETLAKKFAEGAEKSGNAVEFIRLADYNINFCRGCLACGKTKQCAMKDDAGEIIQKISGADAVVFATPIYYYEMSGLMKTMLDRCNPLYQTDYRFRDIYFLSAAADDEPWVPERAINGLGGWLYCYPKCRLAGTVFAGGVNQTGEIAGHPALEQAYEMGRNV